MARRKKKETLTSEERLQAALVPESEQPYKVPKNWCWTRLSNLCTLSNGKAFKPADWAKTGIPIVRIQNLNNPGAEYNLYSGAVADKFKLCGGELLFAWSGTPGTSFGAHIWWGKEAVLNQHIFRVDFDERYISKIYFKYAINQQLDMLISVAHGGAGLQHVTKGVFEATPIPLPPFVEQQRIVDRIESLFAKLDEAKQKAQDALDSFETRKAAILHKAFTGDLTAQWRNEHGVGMESWNYLRFEDCILKMQNGLAKRSGNSGESFVVLRLANLSDNGFLTDDLREILLDEKEQKNYSLEDNDVLMIRVNGSKDNVGKQFLFYGKRKWAFCDHIIRITYNTNLSPQYMVYFSKTSTYRRYIEDNMVSSAGQNTISRKGMASLITPIPLMDEQAEIVRILDDLLAKEQQVKNIAERVLEQTDLIKKSILARAFRGKLGTNNPNEESSISLLKEIIFSAPPKKVTSRSDKPVEVEIPIAIQKQLTTAVQEKVYRYVLENPLCTVAQVSVIEKNVLETVQALRELEEKSLILRNPKDDTLAVVI